ncbi:Winged helix-turn-helix DNA-binding domain [Phytophthora cactorum]|nr:Winged helix-turn-helix DNA-binding domain [Phytophthora cactorum]
MEKLKSMAEYCEDDTTCRRQLLIRIRPAIPALRLQPDVRQLPTHTTRSSHEPLITPYSSLYYYACLLIVPLLLALHALVEGRGRLVGRPDLDLHEVRLVVLAVGAASCSQQRERISVYASLFH